MGGLFGGSSQPQQQAPASFSQGGNPAAYQPTAQPQADTQFQQLVSQLYGPAWSGLEKVAESTQGLGPAGWAFPYAQNAFYGIQANPYAQQGIDAAQYLSQNVAPWLSSFGPQLGQAGQGLLSAGQSELGLAPQLIAAGFDPQNALFNRLQNQTSQGAQAANAAAGVSGPYAASTADQALQNFNINWQNQQLQRELAGAQGAGQALGAGGNAISQGTNIIGQISPIEQQALALKMAPGQAYQAQQTAALNALGPVVNIGEGSFNEANSVLANLSNYLNLGRQASLASGQLGNLGFNQAAQSAQGLGGLAGLGSNFLFGNEGLSGALGLGSGGLVGDLFGGGAADFSGGAAGTAAAAADPFAAGTVALDALTAALF